MFAAIATGIGAAAGGRSLLLVRGFLVLGRGRGRQHQHLPAVGVSFVGLLVVGIGLANAGRSFRLVLIVRLPCRRCSLGSMFAFSYGALSER